MSWKERYNFPKQKDCLNRRFTLKPKEQLNLEDWNNGILENSLGHIYKCMDNNFISGLRLVNINNPSDYWGMGYDFLKSNFVEIKDEI